MAPATHELRIALLSRSESAERAPTSPLLTHPHIATYEVLVRIASLLVVAAGVVACGHDAPDAIPNVRLGMAPRDVRDRFAPGGTDPGTWQTGVGQADDTFLTWTSHDPKTAYTDARFEFHNGMLVAIRANSADKLGKEDISTTPRTVTVKEPADGGTTITVLARDCPTHKEEAEGFVQRAH